MKGFWTVLKFEVLNYLKNKAFIITTVVLSAMLIIGLSIPTIIDVFSDDGGTVEDMPIEEGPVEEVAGDGNFAYIDNSDGNIDLETLKANFLAGSLKEFHSKDKMEEAINEEEIEAGYILEGELEYKNVIKNNEMTNMGDEMFREALAETYRVKSFQELGVDYDEVEGLISPQVQSDTVILGKDSSMNFLYTYILIFALYFVIIMYGQLIASGVASEKSNRAMEVLVTSTDPKNLIFGKVIGGAVASFMQLAVIISVGMITYRINSEAWSNSLDFLFDIPGEVLLNFAVFGTLGYLFYAFIFGALGALVSRTEDINASATPITLIFVVVFFITITGMQNTGGIVLKVASFVPFSSFMAMFVRVSMGSVKLWEVGLSLLILVGSTVLIGILASKIYRMGTLRYGNPIKLKDALKSLKDD